MLCAQYHVIATFFKKKKNSCCAMAMNYSSFPARYKVGNVDIFVLLKFENKLDTVTM